MKIHPIITLGTLLAAELGCSSGGGTHAGDGAASAAGTGGNTAGSGSGGTTGGSAGKTGTVADAQAALNPTEICRAAIKAQCDRRGACSKFMSAVDQAQCSKFAELCPEYYFGADSNRSPEGIRACLDAISAITCTDLDVGYFFPRCLNSGKVADNRPCAFSSQCQSGLCQDGLTGCGTCSPSVPLGGTCSGVTCSDGTFCHPTAQKCMDIGTIVHARQGEPCDLTASPTVGCVGDLHCINTNGVSTCQPAPAAGQACVSSSGGRLCAAGATCDDASTTCVAFGNCAKGASCDSTSFCQNGACAPRSNVGGPCDTTTSGADGCVPPALCTGKICQIRGGRGDTCDGGYTCNYMLKCVDGTCQAFDAASCSKSDAGP